MARYEDDRNYYERDEGDRRTDRFNRERPWNYNEPFPDRGRSQEHYSSGRFGERAEYETNEPRYGDYSGRRMERDRYYDRDYSQGRREDYAPRRSRLRCRDIMTRDLAVATRDTPLSQIAIMMKDEDTGVIPVVDYEANGGNGGEGLHLNDRRPGRSNYGKLVGLVTDRDIVVRAVSEDKECRGTRTEEIMSTDILKANPNERVVDVLRKMADKQVRRIPVVSDNGNLRGMISLGDIALETEADRELGEAIEEISRKASFWGRIFS